LKEFVRQYGAVLCSILVGILLLGIFFFFFQPKWREQGTIEDSNKTNFAQQPKRKERPILVAQDQQFCVGDKIDIKKIAMAKEWGQNGRDLSGNIKWTITGGNLSVSRGLLDTSHTGKANLKYSVKSANGLLSEKEIVILVDIQEGKRKYENDN